MSTDEPSPSILNDPKTITDILYISGIVSIPVLRQFVEKVIAIKKANGNGKAYIEIRNNHIVFIGADMKERPAGDFVE